MTKQKTTKKDSIKPKESIFKSNAWTVVEIMIKDEGNVEKGYMIFNGDACIILTKKLTEELFNFLKGGKSSNFKINKFDGITEKVLFSNYNFAGFFTTELTLKNLQNKLEEILKEVTNKKQEK